jgi:hypothetical protein
MRMRHSRFLALAAVLVVAACSTDLPVGPELTAPTEAPLLTSHDLLEVSICKTWLGDGPVPDVDWTFNWEASLGEETSTGSTTIFPADFVEVSGCVPLGSWPAGTQLTVSEEVPTGYVLRRILLGPRDGSDGPEFFNPDPPSVTFNVSDIGGVWFKNDEFEIPPPPGGGEGCTPGFWRQPHHFQYWTDYAPSDSYADVFGVSRNGTLLQNVTARGGGENALARHAVAALLSASSPDVDYDLSVAEVIETVQNAYATGLFEAAKDLLEGFNEQGCPL